MACFFAPASLAHERADPLDEQLVAFGAEVQLFLDEELRPAGQVIDRVVREDGVERSVGKRQPLCRIDHLERYAGRQALAQRRGGGGLNAMRVDIYADG